MFCVIVRISQPPLRSSSPACSQSVWENTSGALRSRSQTAPGAFHGRNPQTRWMVCSAKSHWKKWLWILALQRSQWKIQWVSRSSVHFIKLRRTYFWSHPHMDLALLDSCRFGSTVTYTNSMIASEQSQLPFVKKSWNSTFRYCSLFVSWGVPLESWSFVVNFTPPMHLMSSSAVIRWYLDIFGGFLSHRATSKSSSIFIHFRF